MKKSWIVIGCFAVVMVFVFSCKKEKSIGESSPSAHTKVFFTLDTTVSLQEYGDEPIDGWEAWDYPQTTTGKDSLFGPWPDPLPSGYFFDLEDISNVSIFMSNGARLDSITLLCPDTV